MARYDRIARLDAPARDDAFGGWLSLRDLDGREREPELGRRARLHFLALRPVRRLLQRGLDGPSAQSLAGQVDTAREALEQLPADHAGRDLLTRYLEEIGGRSPSGLVRATLDVGASAEIAGHLYAAEEFYRVAMELAREHADTEQYVAALRHLGRVQRERGEWEEAVSSLEASALLADSVGAATEWARSMEALAAVQQRSGDVASARATLDRVSGSDHAASHDHVRGIGEAGRCALELAQDDPEAALEAGWAAVALLPADDEARNGVLLNMGAAFRRLGLLSAASSCYEIVSRWAAWPEHRIEAELERALVAAEGGDNDTFRTHRERVMEDMSQVDRPLQALVELGLGRGSLLLGDDEDGRDHLRTAISTARDVGYEQVLERSEELLATLEERRQLDPPATLSPTPDARRIGEEIRELSSQPAAESGRA
jgi:tetratricopeptide (TPR) repeat protein